MKDGINLKKKILLIGIIIIVIGIILTYALGYGTPPGFSEPIFFWKSSILGILVLIIGIIMIIIGLILRSKQKC